MTDEKSARSRKGPSRSIVVPVARPDAFPAADRSGIVVPVAAPAPSFTPDPSAVSFKGRGPKGYRRTDDHILHAVEEALAADETLDASDIEVAVENGEVTLRGLVGGVRARYAAVADAEAIAGKGRVRHALKIVGEP
jgi:hypothetical protein